MAYQSTDPRNQMRYYSMAESSAVEEEAVEALITYLAGRPGTLLVEDVRADPSYRTADVDLLWTWHGASGQDHVTWLEVKADRWHGTGNFFFEIESNRGKGTPGCFLYTRADQLLYYFVTPRTLYALPMPATRDWFLANQDRFPEHATSTQVGGSEYYITVGCLVPIAEVLKNVAGVVERQI
jgi:hypothetical protein